METLLVTLAALYYIWLAFLIAVPALYAWWRGRRIRAMPDDQLLPERLVEERKHNAYVLTAVFVVLMISGGGHLLWAVPLTVTLLVAADFPARRQIYGETWSLGAYLWFMTRWFVAFHGFWVALALAPALIHLSGSLASSATMLAAAVLLAWNARFHRVFLRLFRAARLVDPAMVSAFAAVIQRASVPAPGVWVADARGGFVPAAFALPGKPGGVLFLQSLLDRLPLRESVAVFAHEVAHLEQYAPRILRMLNVIVHLLIALAVLLPHLVSRVMPDAMALALSLWPIFLLVLLAFRNRLGRPLETDGDRRAAQLCGDPEAMASALVRLHAMARMPRRLDVETERWASHPSLARRVQALRTLAGDAGQAPVAHEPRAFPLLEPRGVLTFDPEGLRVASGDPATTVADRGTLTRYGDVHELRVEVPAGRQPRLVGRDRFGRAIQLTIREADAPAVQSALDSVDGLFAPELPGAARSLASLLAATAAVIAVFWASAVPVFVAAAVAAFRPSVATMGAAGVGTVAGGAIEWWKSGAIVHAPAVILLTIGVAILAGAWTSRRDELDRGQRVMAGLAGVVLGVGAAVSWSTGVLLPGATAFTVHRAIGVAPGVAVFPASLAVLLLAYARAGGGSPEHATASKAGREGQQSRPVLSAGAAVAALLAIVPLVAASSMFAERVVDDPLLSPAPHFQMSDATIRIEREIEIQHGAVTALSPGGRWLAMTDYEESSDSNSTTYVFAGAGGERLTLSAAAAAFADEGHVLAAVEDGQGVSLELRGLRPGLPIVWSERLANRRAAALDVSAARRTWRLMDWAEDGGVLAFQGTIGTPGHESRQWSMADAGDTQGMWYVGSGEYAVRTAGLELPTVSSLLAQGLTLRTFTGYRRLAVVDTSGTVREVATELKAQCVSPPVGESSVTCTAFDGLDTRLFRVGETLVTLSSVRGRLWLTAEHEDGTLVGLLDGDYVLGRPDGDQIVRWRDDEDEGWFEIVYAAGRVAAARGGEGPRVVQIGTIELGGSAAGRD